MSDAAGGTGTATCGCCAGTRSRTPLAVTNRPGLSAVAYRVGTHPDFLAGMLAGLGRADRPRLRRLGTREPDDLAVALLDGWAVVADVITFYSERLAQESYLRTATQRTSLVELARLVGHRPRPGLAARTWLAFAVEHPPLVPAAASKDPGSLPPVVPAEVEIEVGLRVQSIPGPGERPQTFQTLEAVTARPEWNAMTPPLTVPYPLAAPHTDAWVQSSDLAVKAGDTVLLDGGPVGSPFVLRTLTGVDRDDATGRTRLRWADALTATYTSISLLRGRFRLFGHNAPGWKAMSTQFRTDYAGTTAGTEWPDTAITGGAAPSVDLEGEHTEVPVGQDVVIVQGSTVARRAVTSRVQLSRAQYAISGPVTRLGLSSAVTGFDMRGALVLGLAVPLTLAEGPAEATVGPEHLDVTADVSGMEPGRRLVLTGTGEADPVVAHVTVAAVSPTTGGRWRVTTDEPLPVLQRETVLVHGNVAPAGHGETVRQVLGSGEGSAAFQRFPLAHEPLTHLRSATDPAAGDPALEVRVNDVLWRRVPTLHGAAPQDRAYVVRTDETGRTVVGFGDGVHGARLPSGTSNVRATYRTGLGGDGNVGPGSLAQLLDRPLGLKGVANPSPAAGGVDPDPPQVLRRQVPIGVLTLGRAVSVLDYADLALASSGVAAAHAAVVPLRGGRTVVVSVVLDGAGEDEDTLALLGDGLRGAGDPLVPVQVLPGHVDAFRLGLQVSVHPDHDDEVVLTAVDAAVRQEFALDRRDFLAPVQPSAVVAVVHGVPGVVAVRLTRLYVHTVTAHVVQRLLAQQPGVDATGDAVPAGLLVVADDPFDELVVAP